MMIDHIAHKHAIPKIEPKHLMAWGASKKVDEWLARRSPRCLSPR